MVVEADLGGIVKPIVIDTLGLLKQVHTGAFVQYGSEVTKSDDGG